MIDEPIALQMATSARVDTDGRLRAINFYSTWRACQLGSIRQPEVAIKLPGGSSGPIWLAGSATADALTC